MQKFNGFAFHTINEQSGTCGGPSSLVNAAATNLNNKFALLLIMGLCFFVILIYYDRAFRNWTPIN